MGAIVTRRALPRIPRDVPKGKRAPNTRVRKSHRDFINSLSCVCCGSPSPSVCAHVRITEADHPGSGGGTSYRPPDRFTVPLCQPCHDHQHAGELTFWAELGIDPLDLALRLWTVTGNFEEGERAIFRARQTIELKARGKLVEAEEIANGG